MVPDLVITDSNVVDVLIKNGELLNRFNFLLRVKSLYDTYAGCIPCQQLAAAEALRVAIKESQKHIAMMPAADQQELKRILKVGTARVFYTHHVNGNLERQRVDF